MSRLGWVACAAFLLAFSMAGCARRTPVSGVLFVTLDTTRADHVGCYGYASGHTPSVDGLAKDAVRFDQAVSAIPLTLPSHSTMFTGTYPFSHGVRYNGIFKLSGNAITLAKLLRDAGWATGAVPASYPVNATTGLNQGFETYRDLFEERKKEKLSGKEERKAGDVTRLGLEWLRAHRDGKFFLWLHYFDPHYPYEPPFPYSQQFHERPYDGEIAYADAELGKVLDALREMGILDRTLVIVVGDHGEGLYDHGEKMHSNLAYESTIRVPLIVRAPGRERGEVVKEPVSLADLAPTVLDYAGIAIPSRMEGISLRPALTGGRLPRRALYFESLSGSLIYGWSPLEGVRLGKWKLIRGAKPELYALDTDPGEQANVYPSEADIGRDLEERLGEILASAKEAPSSEAAPVPLDPETLERLASLGYVGGAISEERKGGPNPRDMVHLEAEILFGQELMDRGEFVEALESWLRVLKDDPGNRFALLRASNAAGRVGKLDEATRYAEELERRYPEFKFGTMALGDLWVAREDYGRAESTFRAGLARHPDDPALAYKLALAMIAQGRIREAAATLDAALPKAKPEQQPGFQVARALCRSQLGDEVGARDTLRDAIAKGYRDRETLEKEPLLAPLRAVPGFQEELDKIKPAKP